MSSIVSIVDAANPAFPTTISGSHLEVIAPQGQENIIDVRGGGPISIVGGPLRDEITIETGDANVLGLGGNDVIRTGLGNDTILGGRGDDLLESGEGADVLFGGDGDDTIYGGPAGENRNGEIIGDLLEGGAGNDVFEFELSEFESGAVDQIVDFRDGGDNDVIRILGSSDENVNVTYDPETGLVSIDGRAAIDIGADLGNVEPTRRESDGTWEIF